MFLHPDLTMDLARDHQRELRAEADRSRLLTLSRRQRRQARRSAEAAARPAARGRPDGTLAACGSRVAAPAR
jgi:hypothetical protein